MWLVVVDEGRDVVFLGTDAAGTALFRYDSSSGLVERIAVTAANIKFLCAFDDDSVYFQGFSDAYGAELWMLTVSSGTVGITKDILVGAAGSVPSHLARYDNFLFFAAFGDGENNDLYAYDPVEQIATRVASGWTEGPRDLTPFQGILYFSAADDAHGRELWSYNIQSGLPALVADAYPGSGNSDPAYLYGFGNRIWFEALNAARGRELHSYHVDSGRVRCQADIWPGSEGGGAAYVAGVGTRVYYGADDGTNGDELWSFRYD
jgi:ELWxxDGT repeat protein